MGLYDREYYREEEERRWQHASRPLSMVTWLIIANVVFFAANLFFSRDNSITNFMALKSDLFHAPWNAWQLLTAGFAHAPIGSPTGIMHILMNMYGLFLFGREVEHKYGRYEFLWMYLAAIVFSNLGWVAIRTLFGVISGSEVVGSAYGASGGVMAVVVLFCLCFPKRMLYLFGVVGVPAWAIGVTYVAIDFLHALGLSRDSHIAWQAHLAGALYGLLYFNLGFRFTRILPARAGAAAANWIKNRPKLRVHDPDDDAGLDDEADRLLEKVHRQGEESLTAKERRVLEDYSRRMRQKRG